MTAMMLAVGVCCFVALVGLALLLFKNDRGTLDLTVPGFNLKGGVGAVLLLAGVGGVGYLIYHPVSPNPCILFCPTTKVFNFPDQNVRQSNGKSGSLSDIRVTLVPPDSDHPNGQFIATWVHSGSGGTHGGTQNVDVKMKGTDGADLPSPPPFGLPRDRCEATRQNFGGDLPTPFNGIAKVEIEPSIVQGDHTGGC